MVIDVMRELDVDLRSVRPRRLTDDLVREADVVVRCLTPDADDYAWPTCDATFIDWSVPMPANQDDPTMNDLRALRDALAARVEEHAFGANI